MIKVAFSSSDVARALPDVPLHHRPTSDQFNYWRSRVEWEEGADPDGNFRGKCVVHEHEAGDDQAMYKFWKDTFKCEGEVTDADGEVWPFDDKRRNMTLTNAVRAIAARVVSGPDR